MIPQVRQMFERLSRASAAADADARFEHFRAHVWPRIQAAGSSGCLIVAPAALNFTDTRSGVAILKGHGCAHAGLADRVCQCEQSPVRLHAYSALRDVLACMHACAGQLLFCSSYFDYVRLRAFLKAQGAPFAGLSEYAAPSQAARARSLFADGRLRLALLTERAHFYFRARVRGVQARPPDSAPCSLACATAVPAAQGGLRSWPCMHHGSATAAPAAQARPSFVPSCVRN